jgi:hypothetical protein
MKLTDFNFNMSFLKYKREAMKGSFAASGFQAANVPWVL